MSNRIALLFFVLLQIFSFNESKIHESATTSALKNDLEDGPVQLVAPADDHKSLVVLKDNLKLLSNIPGPVAVVSVVGKFHSGKSFLMNQLMGKSSGFGIGPSVKPMTMGIWMWGKPAVMKLASGLKVSVVFLDTEGFAASNISENYDAKIFAVATLLSSQLLYNSVKIIDQADIDYLEVLARRTQLFALRSQMSRSKWTDNFNENLLSFPPLLWVVQDFYQDILDGETPQQWLHSLMSTHTKEAEDYQISIMDIFKSVDCHTLFLPAVSKKLLNNLALASEADLTEEYRDERNALIEKLKKQITPKTKNNKPIHAAELSFLLEVLVSAANEGYLADIPTRWHSFVERLEKTATEDCLKFYEDELRAFLNDKYSGKPVKSSRLIEWHNQTEQRAFELLKHLLNGLEDALTQASSSLQGRIAGVFELNRDLNEKKIRLKVIEIHNGVEIKTEDILRRLSLPMSSASFLKEVEILVHRMSKQFATEIMPFIEEDAESSLVEPLVNSLKNIAAKMQLINQKKIVEFYDKFTKEAVDKFNLIVSSDKTNAPRKPVLLKKVIKEAVETSSKLFKQRVKIFENEDLYSARILLLDDKLKTRSTEVENENEILAVKHMRNEAAKLIDSYTDRTSSQFIQLPINDTDLETRLSMEMSRVIKEFEETLGEYVVYSNYLRILDELKKKIDSISGTRRTENVKAFAKEVHRPLEMAKRIILLSADKYSTVFSYKQFIRSVCLVNLDEGKPKSWPLSLKSQIIENFMVEDVELNDTIRSKESIWSAILGFFQWLLWLFNLS